MGKRAGRKDWKSTTSFALGRKSFLHGLLFGAGFTGADDAMVRGIVIIKHLLLAAFFDRCRQKIRLNNRFRKGLSE